MKMNRRRIGILGASGALVASGSLLGAPAASAVNPSCDGLALSTSGSSSCDVPAGVTALTVAATGAGGGGANSAYAYGSGSGRGGHGATVTYVLTVTPGETLVLEVGSGGASAPTTNGGGGGGWTAVKRGATLLVVAGGGGGAGVIGTGPGSTDGQVNGGDGAAAGTADGGAGAAPTGGQLGPLVAAGGGTPSNGGSGGTPGNYTSFFNGTAGSSGAGGAGGCWTSGCGSTGGSGLTGGVAGGGDGAAGGGGAGYFGGGGGANTGYNQTGGAGGAGSSYPFSGATYSTATNGGAAGSNGGNGSIQLAAYVPPAPPAPPAPSAPSTAVTVNISLSTNGGTGSVPSLSGDQGTWVTLPSGSVPSRSGYTFAGWNSAPDGAGATYAAGSSIQLNGDNTLYAMWVVVGTSGSGEQASTPASVNSAEAQPTTVPSQLQPGQSLLLVSGVPHGVSVAPKPSGKGLAITGDNWTMDLDGLGPDGKPLKLGPNGVLVLQSERDAQTSGTGFKPNSPVVLFIDPPVVGPRSGNVPRLQARAGGTSLRVGTLTTRGDGSFAGTVMLPAGIAPGTHVLQANGLAPDSATRSLNLGVLVTQTSAKNVARASVFFAPLSPDLNAKGKASLQALVRETGKKVTSVRCVGFVQPTGSTGNDESLSTARAESVAAYLRSLGVKGVYVVRGDGRDEATGAKARRVDVAISHLSR